MVCAFFWATFVSMSPIANAGPLESRQSTGQSFPWYNATGIAYGNNMFVVLGYEKNNSIYMSQNLLDWSEVLTYSSGDSNRVLMIFRLPPNRSLLMEAKAA